MFTTEVVTRSSAPIIAPNDFVLGEEDMGVFLRCIEFILEEGFCF